jgi:hypothetical protein
MNVTISAEQQPTKKEIYRYKFSQDFMNQLEIFAIEHEEDDIADFKEAWESWIEDNNQLIATEINSLHEKNFQGDALDKMFFSARYYYRKKDAKKSTSTKTGDGSKETKKQNIKYSSSRTFLEQMDNHIKSQDLKTKPSKCFDDFVTQHSSIIEEEYRSYLNKQDQTPSQTEEPEHPKQPKTLDEKAFQDKMKKTYKNRIFVIRNTKPANETNQTE